MSKTVCEATTNIAEGVLSWEQLSYMDTLIGILEGKVERAECIIQDLMDDYFSMNPDHLKENMWKLYAEYDRHRTKTEIVFDYLYDIKKELEAAYKRLEDEYARYRERKGIKEPGKPGGQEQ